MLPLMARALLELAAYGVFAWALLFWLFDWLEKR